MASDSGPGRADGDVFRPPTGTARVAGPRGFAAAAGKTGGRGAGGPRQGRSDGRPRRAPGRPRTAAVPLPPCARRLGQIRGCGAPLGSDWT